MKNWGVVTVAYGVVVLGVFLPLALSGWLSSAADAAFTRLLKAESVW